MSSEFREDYKANRDLGMSHNQARVSAMSTSTLTELRRQVEDQGLTFEDDLVKAAVVHARQDIAIVCELLGQQMTLQRTILRWTRICAFLLVLVIAWIGAAT